VGKPAAAFFAAALAHLDAGAARTLMVGDDIETDMLAAQRLNRQAGRHGGIAGGFRQLVR
jgi:ribonucleotide monophosphatase NagD (HAD superfamily)